MLAAQAIIAGDAEVVVAGGMESMSNVPYYLPKARTGYRMGNGTIIDGMVHDGLWDCYNNYHMGSAGELCSREMDIPRKEQDDFSVESYKRALNAIEKGLFNKEIVAVEIKDKKGSKIVAEDEEPKKTNFEKGLALRPAFEKDGTITAFNASKINDGASALVVMSKEKAKELGVKPLARIVAQTSFAQEPEWFTTAPAYAIQNVVKKANMKLEDIDIFEINEAFAVQALAVIKVAKLDASKVNLNGGAVALGHPIGASGARILTTLIHVLEQQNKKFGLATLCIGGGEASALIIERL
jgi:acetyl-CoA C-acetyltransferase